MFVRKAFPRSLIVAALLSVVGGRGRAATVQQAEPLRRPPGVDIVTLPLEPGGRFRETSVAVNPRDVRHVLVSYFHMIGDDWDEGWGKRIDVQAAWSADGGKSWTVAAGTAPPNYLVSADPSVTFDLHGNAFLAYGAVDDHGPAFPYWAKGTARNGVFVRRSLDGGRTWERSPIPVVEHPTMRPFADKHYLVADNNPSSPHTGSLYVGWASFSLDRSEILFSRSTDEGRTWSQPLVISTDPGVPRGSVPGALTGFHAAVGRDGTVYAIWTDGQALVLAVSRDGGQTFEPSRRVVPTTFWGAGVTDFPAGYGFPAVAIDPRGSPGRLFVTWGDYRYGDVDILASTSDDGGRTWTPPVRVNNDAKHNGKDQVLSWLAVDPTDGAAYVVFYDRRGDPKNALPTVTLARSIDGGRTFTNYAWSVTASDPKRVNYGDYIGLAARDGRVYGAWTENAPTPHEAASPAVSGSSVIRIGIADFRAPGRASGEDAGRR